MNAHTSTVYLTAWQFGSTKPGDVMWQISTHRFDPGTKGVLGQWPHEITVPLPDDFNPVAAEVASLEAQKLQALQQYQTSVAVINERLSKVLALTNEVAE